MRVCKTFAEALDPQGSHRLVSQQYWATLLAMGCAFACHGAVLADAFGLVE